MTVCDKRCEIQYFAVFHKGFATATEKAIEQFEIEVKNGRDSDVKAWAEKWLPTLQEHLKLARAAVTDVKGS